MVEEDQGQRLHPANDNGGEGALLDPRILRIAQAVGSQLARDMARPVAANDNEALPPQSGEGARR